nr:family 78 glycoside hydrolase catalytic domain [uncultured Eisenbergiella sp.]
MKISDLRTEYRHNPIGLDIQCPRFSWILESEEQDVVQQAYHITVQTEKETVWDSGRTEGDTSVLVPYEGKSLMACTRYRLTVRVWDNKGKTDIREAWFETGLLSGKAFQAEWITHDFPKEEKACPIFFKEFSLPVGHQKEIAYVRIYATALGMYEIRLNGRKVGDTFFAPGWTNYKQRLQYQTYETDIPLEKENRLEITVGNGWYKGILGFACTPCHYGDRVAVLAELHLVYRDGTRDILRTDESWSVKTGYIRSSEIYMGETIDSLWECRTGTDGDNKNEETRLAVPGDYGKERILAQESEPVRITHRLPAQKLIVTTQGERVIDFGQNITGLVEMRIIGKKGQKVTVRHAETLDKNGNFYPDTLRQAVSHDVYILNGQEQTFLPHFTFHGFRYICVEGAEEEQLVLKNFTACAMHTDLEQTGSFCSSHPLVNQLISNIQWGQWDNFLDIPTDCPQRDERLGWTGDAQVFSGTAMLNCNTALFFTKWLHDLASEQTREHGVPHVIPNILGEQDGAAGWSDAAVIIPWNLYQIYGDRRILEEQYESMKGWVDFITAHTEKDGLWQTGFQYGDWLALDKEESADRTGATDKYLAANVFYAACTAIVVCAAEITGRKDDAKNYRQLHDTIKEAFNREYITATGRLVSETQTACVLSLHFRLAKEEYRERIMQSLVMNIANHKDHLSTGFMGTPYLCHVLSENGQHELAGRIFRKEDYPSWLYPVKMGATTVWERWNSIMPDGSFDESGMNSLNHYAYGSIEEWMYRKLAGINQLEPGFRRILIKPMLMKGITRVKAAFNSPYGKLECAWICENHKITVDICIPVNTHASVFLPEKKEGLELGSGSYHFVYETQTDLTEDKFSMESALGQFMEEPAAVEMFNQLAPGMLDNPMIGFAKDMSISELTAQMPAEGKQLFEAVITMLNKVDE